MSISAFAPSQSTATKPQLAWWPRLLLALVSGALMPLSLAPYGIWPLAIVCPAILYTLLRSCSTKQAFWLGEAFGIGLWGVGVFWLFHSIYYYSSTPLIAALGMIGFVAVVMGLFTAISVTCYQRFWRGQPLVFAAWWVIAEWCKTWVFTGFPWLFAGYAVTETPLAGLAPITGVFGVSLVLLIMAGVLGQVAYQIGTRRRVLKQRLSVRDGLALVWLPILSALSWAATQVNWTQVAGKPIAISLVQGNIPQDIKWLASFQEETLKIYQQLSREEWGRDLVVWPEASIPMFQTDPLAADFIALTNQVAQHFQTSWITGLPYQAVEETTPQSDYTPFYNTIYASGYQGNGLYRKQRLVPFGEYTPFEGALKWVLPSLKNNPAVSSFSAGQPYQPLLQIKRHIKIGSALCYEVAYPNISRQNAQGANVLLTISNDAWFGQTAGPHQHLQMVQMRAREAAHWYIRATNTGITAVIDDQGRIRQQIPQFERSVLRADVPPMQGMTPYVRYGDTPILVFCGLMLIGNLGYRMIQHRQAIKPASSAAI